MNNLKIYENNRPLDTRASSRSRAIVLKRTRADPVAPRALRPWSATSTHGNAMARARDPLRPRLSAWKGTIPVLHKDTPRSPSYLCTYAVARRNLLAGAGRDGATAPSQQNFYGGKGILLWQGSTMRNADGLLCKEETRCFCADLAWAQGWVRGFRDAARASETPWNNVKVFFPKNRWLLENLSVKCRGEILNFSGNTKENIWYAKILVL